MFTYTRQLNHNNNNKWGRKKLNVGDSVIKAFYQKGITPIGKVGRKAARLMVREAAYAHKIRSMIRHAKNVP